MKTTLVMSLLSVLSMCICPCGCRQGQRQADNSGGNTVLDYVFTDRSDPIFETVFVLREGQVLAQVAEFPGYRNRTYYMVSALPSELHRTATGWSLRKAGVSPPFVPGGPNFSITQVPRTPSKAAETRYFKSDNQDIEGFLRDLRAYVVTKRNKISEPPEWVMRGQKIRAHLGM